MQFSTNLRALFAVPAVMLCLVVEPALAQDVDFPVLEDRTSEFLRGLSNDNTAKTIELGDFNNDGWEDLAISRRESEPVLLVNNDGVLVNQTASFLPGSASANNSLYVEAFDADGDGWTDIVFAVRNANPRLMMNLGEDGNGEWLGFDTGSSIAGTTNNLVLEAGDINGDGADDLFAIKVEQQSNDLLINDGSGNFSIESSRLGGLGTLRRGHMARLADVEGDGDVDVVYIESDLFLYIYFNDGTGNFSDRLRRTFRNPDNFAYVFGAGDFNGDGIFDFRQYSNPAPLAEMSTGEFDGDGLPLYQIRQDANMLRGNRKHGTLHVRDIDGDGDLDYVLSSVLRNFGGLNNSTEGMRTEMVFNRGLNTGNFQTFVGTDWGNEESHDMKIIDVNNDGNMDLFIGHTSRYGVYVNAAAPVVSDIELDDSVSASAIEVGIAQDMSVSLVSGNATSFTWDFGDGVVRTTGGPTITHTFSEPGRFLVSVTARGPRGSDQLSFTQRVHEPLVEGLAVSSMDTVYESRADNDRVYVVNPDNDSVTVIDAVVGNVIAEIPVGDEPRSLALDDTGILRVVNKGDATVTRVNTNSLSAVDSISFDYGSRPHGIVFDADKRYAYVALEAKGQIVKIDFQGQEVIATIDAGPTPRDLGLSGDGSILYAPRFITLPGPDESTREPAAHGGEVLVIDTNSMTISGTINLPYNNPTDGVDTGVNARGIPNYLRSPALSPSGNLAIVPMKLDNIYRGSMRDGLAREHDMLTRGALAHLDLTSETENLQRRFQFDNNSHPTAVAFGPTGNHLFVVHEASRQFEVIDVYANEIVFSDTLEFAPTGIVVSPDGRRAYAHNWLSRSLSMIDTSGLIDGSSNNADTISTIGLVESEALAERILAGKRLYFDSGDLRLSAQKYISCAGCHDEAGHDGRVWDFSDAGEGLRNTIDLRGRAGIGDGNVHWSANFNEIHDFEHDIREIFDGTGLLTDQDFQETQGILDPDSPKAGRSAALDALAAFTSTLRSFGDSPHRTADGNLTAGGQRGKDVFDSSGCVACHNGDHFTDSLTATAHNIGTVDADTGGRLGQPLLNGGLDTPTLRGLWNGAPYLHDGAAQTVQEAVLAHVSNVDFDVNSLSSQQLDDLADYLLQIDDSEPGPSDPLLPPDPLDPLESDTPSNPVRIIVDGDINDWPTSALLVNDANDVSDENNPIDLAQFWMGHDATRLFIRYVNHAPAPLVLSWGYAMYIDVNGAPGYRGFSSELPIGVDYLLEGSSLYSYSGSGNDFSWTFVAGVSAATVGGSAELALLREDLGNPINIQYFLVGNNAAVEGTERDYMPDNATDRSIPAADRSFAYTFSASPETPVVEPPLVPVDGFSNPATAIVIDGSLAEWGRFVSFGPDADDVTGPLNRLDWREAWMAHNASQFYFAWRNDGPAVFSWGNGIMLDTDQNRGTGFTGFNDELATGVDYLIEADQIHAYTGTGTNWSWRTVGSPQMESADSITEMSVRAELLGNPSVINVFYYADNQAVEGDAVDFYPDAASDPSQPLDQRYFTYTTLESVPVPELIPIVDGRLNEWRNDFQLGEDDGQNLESSDTIDWKRLYLTNSDSTLYVGYENHNPVALNWGYGIYLDTDNNRNTGFRGFASELAVGADFLLEGNALYQYTGASQTEWSWNAGAQIDVAVAGNSAEIAIPVTALNSPSRLALVMRGDNAAVDGVSVDLLPDNGSLVYSLVTRTPVDSFSPDGDRLVFNDSNLPSPTLPRAATALPSQQPSGGSGAFGLPGLFFGVLLLLLKVASVAWQKLHRVRLDNKGCLNNLVPASVCRSCLVLSAVLVSSCDSSMFGDSGGVDDPQDQSASSQIAAQPNNRPGFVVSPDLGAANSDNNERGATNDPSIALGVSVELQGSQIVPVVSSNDGGVAQIAVNPDTAELTGRVQHTLNDAVSAAIYQGAFGSNGTLLFTLLSSDSDNGTFAVPPGTYLDETQQQLFNAGDLYVLVSSITHPGGHLRAQLTDRDQSLTVLPTLDDLQAKIFAPTCSGCHTGGGDTLPASMDFTSSNGTFTSLVNIRSQQTPELTRVVSGFASLSYLVHKLEGTQQNGSQMPFRSPPLSASKIAAIKTWIDNGALP